MEGATQKAGIDAETQNNINLWLDSPIDESIKDEIRQLIKKEPKKAIDAFYQRLHFGTGGIRGIMGWGTNRMNIYTVRMATQGLANYILQQKEWDNPTVAISFDSRHHSREFAEEAAQVLAGNGIRSFVFKELRPTPLLSYAVRYHNCLAGIMVTASHNPAEYNGYKVYWNDGAQVLPPNDQGIIREVEKITDFDQIQRADTFAHPLIQEMGTEIDDAYIKDVAPLQNHPKDNKERGKELSIVYTSLHGTGITMVPNLLENWGFTTVFCPKEQNTPDGAFPTTRYPNPEFREALEIGIQEMQRQSADLVVATDPDADRIGVAIQHNGQVELLSGNQLLCVCLYHVCEALKQQNRLPENAAFVKTIVTTELFKAICQYFQRPSFDVLTGFKYIAEKIREWEQDPHGYQYVFGGEESYGSLLGTHVRDKDAVIASALACEVALQAKKQGKTLVDLLHDLYAQFGIYVEELHTINFPDTKEGQEKMKAVLQNLRDNPLTRIHHQTVVCIEDFLSSEKHFLLTKKRERITLPKSNVLVFWLEDQTKLVVRPSGTEPKVKVYCGVVEKEAESVPKGIEQTKRKAADYLSSFEQSLQGK